jgi:hypothetical protein
VPAGVMPQGTHLCDDGLDGNQTFTHLQENTMSKVGWVSVCCLFLLAACLPLETAQVQKELVVNEYRLSSPPDYSTERLVFHFVSGDQEAILAETETYRDYQKQIGEYNNRLLMPLGYHQEDYQKEQFEGSGYFFWYSDIYRGDEKIVDGALFIGPISVNASGTDFIGNVMTYDGDYVLTRGGYAKRPWPAGRAPYLFAGDQLLSIERTSPAHQEILVSLYLDDELAYQSSMLSGAATYGDMDGPWSYGGHWAIVLLDGKRKEDGQIAPMNRVVIDGQDINTLHNYEQSFQFAVLDERPFYFYQREGRIGISFDGQEFAREYDEIPHYRCCSPALLNPHISMNMVRFFARRGEEWYYVEAYLPE